MIIKLMLTFVVTGILSGLSSDMFNKCDMPRLANISIGIFIISLISSIVCVYIKIWVY